MSPGSMPLAREIFQEGLILPPIKLVKRGESTPKSSPSSSPTSAPRTSAKATSPRRSPPTASAPRACSTSSAATDTSAPRTTPPRTQDYAERVIRRTIARIPDGSYEYADALDNDGFSDRPVPIRCAIRILGDSAEVDFTGTDLQTTGGVNANLAITLSATFYAFRCLVTEDVLYNDGIARPITVIAPPGTVVNAQHPSAVAGGNVETSQRITDVVLGALAKALPDRIPAASQGTMNNVTLGGTDPRTGKPFAYYETAGGGMGGRNGLPGLSGVHTHMSNTRNTPVEALEQALPLRITTYALRQGSGGAGAFPGGEGLIREYEVLTETNATILTDRRQSQPYGAQGGAPGHSGRNTLLRADGTAEPLPAKARLELHPGDRLRLETPGGGGFGAA